MGSFNMRCFASGQIIGPGDPYWVIPIKRELTYSARKLTVRGESKERYGTSASFCYPGSYWAPVSGPILLRYEDCCSGKLVHSRANVLWLWVLFHTLRRIRTIRPCRDASRKRAHEQKVRTTFMLPRSH